MSKFSTLFYQLTMSRWSSHKMYKNIYGDENMNLNLFKPFFKIIKFQIKYPLNATKNNFKALVDAIIPSSPELVKVQGSTQSSGALHSHTDEYQIWSLNFYIMLLIFKINVNIYLANLTSKMLDAAANQLIYLGENKMPIISSILPSNGVFASLAPNDRFRAISLLTGNKVNLKKSSILFRFFPDFIIAITDAINMFTTIGYYSEWSGYGPSRLGLPSERKLEHIPTCWIMIGYPGPSKGYHAFRGYLIEEFTK